MEIATFDALSLETLRGTPTCKSHGIEFMTHTDDSTTQNMPLRHFFFEIHSREHGFSALTGVGADATHMYNTETNNAHKKPRQGGGWSTGSLGSGPQPGSSCGSRRPRRRGCSRALGAIAAWPGRGEVSTDHVELLGDESGAARTLDMMKEEPGQPATAHERVCQAAQCVVWRGSDGANTP